MSKVITAGVLIAAALVGLVGLVVLTAPTAPTYVAVTTPAPVVITPPAPAPVQAAYDPNADHVTDLVYMPRIMAEDPGQRPYNP